MAWGVAAEEEALGEVDAGPDDWGGQVVKKGRTALIHRNRCEADSHGAEARGDGLCAWAALVR